MNGNQRKIACVFAAIIAMVAFGVMVQARQQAKAEADEGAGSGDCWTVEDAIFDFADVTWLSDFQQGSCHLPIDGSPELVDLDGDGRLEMQTGDAGPFLQWLRISDEGQLEEFTRISRDRSQFALGDPPDGYVWGNSISFRVFMDVNADRLPDLVCVVAATPEGGGVPVYGMFYVPNILPPN